MKIGTSISLCIASRGEERLGETMRVAAVTAQELPQMCLWFDGCLPTCLNDPSEWIRIGRNDTPEGSGISKHRAISLATGDIIVLIDAHMILPSGWDTAVKAHFSDPAHFKDVFCGKMVPMHEWGKPETPPRTGAEIVLKAMHETGGFRALEAKWKDQPCGEIGCCMGAFYAFRKSWYLAMGEPLGVMQGWGSEEEMLSIGSWIMGGRVVLADVVSAHLTKPPVQSAPGEMGKVWRNRFRLLNVIPMKESLRRELNEWLWNNPISLAPAFVESVGHDAGREEVIALKRLWAAHADGWEKYLARWVTRLTAPSTESAAPVEVKTLCPVKTANVQLLPLSVCPKCGAVDNLRIVRTIQAKGGTVKRYGRCGAKKCPARFTSIETRAERRIAWK